MRARRAGPARRTRLFARARGWRSDRSRPGRAARGGRGSIGLVRGPRRGAPSAARGRERRVARGRALPARALPPGAVVRARGERDAGISASGDRAEEPGDARASGGARRRAGIAARGSPRPRRGGRAPRSASTPPSRAPEATTPGEPTAEGETHGRAPSRGAQDFEDDRARARVDDARGGSTRRPPLRGARHGGEKKSHRGRIRTRRRRDPKGEGSREKKAAFDRVRTRSTVGEKNALERNSPDRRSFVLHVDSTERTLISVDDTRSLACSLCICMTNQQIFKAFDELRTITCRRTLSL